MNPNAMHLPNDDAEAAIERALSTLRDVHPRAGLNTRILASLEPRATNPRGLPFRIAKGWGIARGSARENAGTRTVVWAATAATIVAVAASIVLHHHSASVDSPKAAVILSAARSAQSKDPEVARVTTSPEPFSTTNLASSRPDFISRHPERSASARSRRTPVLSDCPDHPPTACPIHEDEVAMSGPTTDPDAQAVADLHAPSHPAPPLPLTAEEKLFLRMSSAHNETLLAELNPDVRAAQAAAETADFKTFFPEPPPLKQPGDDE